jgi:hypothetical protein
MVGCSCLALSELSVQSDGWKDSSPPGEGHGTSSAGQVHDDSTQPVPADYGSSAVEGKQHLVTWSIGS